MWSFFSRSLPKYDLQWMHADMHSHILPGIDDGSATLADSRQLLEGLQELGLRSFYFTPHVFAELYPNTRDSISAAYGLLQEAMPVAGGYAAEYMLDSDFSKGLSMAEPELLTLPGGYVLIEMSYMQESHTIAESIFRLQTLGYKPILAHPERYLYYHGRPERMAQFREMGCLLQLNLLSMVGYYGSREKQAASYLIAHHLVDLVGTDVHHLRHLQTLQKALSHKDLSYALRACPIKNQELFGQQQLHKN